MWYYVAIKIIRTIRKTWEIFLLTEQKQIFLNNIFKFKESTTMKNLYTYEKNLKV